MLGASTHPHSVPPANLRTWFAANTWAPGWQPSSLRRPFVSYAAAVLAVALAVGLAHLLDLTLAGFGPHTILAYFAVLCVAIAWGIGPALLAATLSAVVLNFVVLSPALAALPVSPSHWVARAVGFLLMLVLAFAISVVACQLARERADRSHALASTRQAHEEASTERDLVRQVVEVLPEGVVILGTDARVTAMNQAAAALFGSGFSGKTRAEFDLAERRPDGTAVAREDRPWMRALATGEMSRGVQLVVRGAAGTDVPLLTSSAPLRDASGTTIGVVSVFQDISAIRSLERQRDRMLATVAHDLRNPLTSITGLSQILQLRVDQVDARVRERFTHNLKTIEEAGRRMAIQINELLDYTQAQTSQALDLGLEPTDIVALLRKMLDEHQRVTERHALILETPEEVLVAIVDPRRLERAIANLLVNAIKYSPEGGPITVSVARAVGPDGQWLSIAVADSGLGIPAGDLPHMFEQYYRASNVAGTIPGTGIGLANVRHAVERHGGTVSIDSAEGEGTTVTLRLPLLPAEAAQPGALG